MPTKKDVRKTIDQLVWDAHFQSPEQKLPLQATIPISTWREYWKALRKESRGYWHGATGRIAERLDIAEDDWQEMIRFHQPEKPICIGDSSHDYSYIIEAAGIGE